MHRLIPLALVVALAIPAAAQDEKPLAFDDVLKLLQLGFGEGEVLAELARTNTTLTLTPAEVAQLQAAGAGPKLLALLAPKPAADPVAQVIAAHRGGRSAPDIVEAILAAKLSPLPASALTPAIQAGVPHSALLALRGTPLAAADLATLAIRKASEDEVALLARGLGLAFALDPKTSLELSRGGVPVAWLARLRQLSGTPTPVPPTPVPPTPVPPTETNPPTPAPPADPAPSGAVTAPTTPIQDPGLSKEGLAFLEALDPMYILLAQGAHARAESIARAQLDTARELGPWAMHAALTGLAWSQMGQGRLDDGFASLERTIALGSIDFEGIHLIVPPEHLGHPRLKALYAAMRIRPAEHAEYLWHRKAHQQLGHETRMMITENMNRPDSDYTQVPDFPIPQHPTVSADVILGRMSLRRTVLGQRRTVQTSDISRINHLLQMKIIRAMPGSADADAERRREEEVRRSRLDAEQRYAQRARRYADLAFTPPQASAPLNAPALGSVDISWLREQVASIAKMAAPEGTATPAETAPTEPATPGTPEAGSDLNPLARARVGDWIRLHIVRTLGDQQDENTLTSTITAIAAGKVQERLTNAAGETSTEETALAPTLQEQLIASFAQQGRVRVLSYKSTPSSFEASGEKLAGRRVALTIEITTDQGASRVDATYEIADAVPLLGVLRAELRFANGLVARVECVGCGRARD